MKFKNEVVEMLSDPIWLDIKSGVFITCYFNEPYVSRNVWCCVSNENFDNSKSVYQNAIHSCMLAITDSRTKLSPDYIRIEIAVLAPKDKWIKSHDLKIEDNCTICIQSDDNHAFFLPNVWSEHPDWLPHDVISHLKDAANIRSYKYDLYKIPTIIINPSGFEYSKFLMKEIAEIIINKALSYYSKLTIHPDEVDELPELITIDGIEYASKRICDYPFDDVSSSRRLLRNLSCWNEIINVCNNLDITMSYSKLGKGYITSNILKRKKYPLGDLIELCQLATSLGYVSIVKKIKEKILSYNKNGIFSSDKSFENPMAVVCTIDLMSEAAAKNFMMFSYHHQVDVLGANSIVKALISIYRRFGWREIINLITDQYLDILRKIDRDCVGQLAASYEAQLLIIKYIPELSWILDSIDVQQYILEHYYDQHTWANGPFRYHKDEPCYDTHTTLMVIKNIIFILCGPIINGH